METSPFTIIDLIPYSLSSSPLKSVPSHLQHFCPGFSPSTLLYFSKLKIFRIYSFRNDRDRNIYIFLIWRFYGKACKLTEFSKSVDMQNFWKKVKRKGVRKIVSTAVMAGYRWESIGLANKSPTSVLHLRNCGCFCFVIQILWTLQVRHLSK